MVATDSFSSHNRVPHNEASKYGCSHQIYTPSIDSDRLRGLGSMLFIHKSLIHYPSSFGKGPLAPNPSPIAERRLESWRNDTPRLYEAPKRKKHALKRRSQAVTAGFRNASNLTYAEVDPGMDYRSAGKGACLGKRKGASYLGTRTNTATALGEMAGDTSKWKRAPGKRPSNYIVVVLSFAVW